jgi:hypothetical protein
MNGKQITTVKYLALKIKIAMQENVLSFEDLAASGELKTQIKKMTNGSCSLGYAYTFSVLMRVCMFLGIENIRFDENNIKELFLKYRVWD